MITKIDSVKYLNRGYVELYDFSDLKGDAIKEAVTMVAAISYGKEKSKNPDRLYKHLIELGHETPFEFVKFPVKFNNGVFVFDYRNHGFVRDCGCYELADHKAYIATFKIKIPVFVARQVMRHRLFSFLEKSKRYTKDFPDMYFSQREKILFGDIDNDDVYENAVYNLREEYNSRLKVLKPEEARYVLPMRMFTEMWMQGDHKAWAYFFVERLHNTAQSETNELAHIMLNLLKAYQPSLIKNIIRFLSTDYQKSELFRNAREEKANKTIKILQK